MKKRARKSSASAGSPGKKVGQTWTHIALEVKSRFAVEMRVDARSLEAAVALCCAGNCLPLFLIDDHRSYPVHVSDLQRDIWNEERAAAQESALHRHSDEKTLPRS